MNVRDNELPLAKGEVTLDVGLGLGRVWVTGKDGESALLFEGSTLEARSVYDLTQYALSLQPDKR